MEKTIWSLHFTPETITVQDTIQGKIWTVIVRPEHNTTAISKNTCKTIQEILEGKIVPTPQLIAPKATLNSDKYLNGEGEQYTLQLEKLNNNVLLVSLIEHDNNSIEKEPELKDEDELELEDEPKSKDKKITHLFYDLAISKMIEDDDMLEYVERIPAFRHYKVPSEELAQLFNLMGSIEQDTTNIQWKQEIKEEYDGKGTTIADTNWENWQIFTSNQGTTIADTNWES